jgi:hypothetical protein
MTRLSEGINTYHIMALIAGIKTGYPHERFGIRKAIAGIPFSVIHMREGLSIPDDCG